MRLADRTRAAWEFTSFPPSVVLAGFWLSLFPRFILSFLSKAVPLLPGINKEPRSGAGNARMAVLDSFTTQELLRDLSRSYILQRAPMPWLRQSPCQFYSSSWLALKAREAMNERTNPVMPAFGCDAACASAAA